MQKISSLIFIFFTCFFSSVKADQQPVAILEAIIELYAPNTEDGTNILPNSPLSLKVTVKNSGTQKNEKGEIFIQFVFPSPLEKEVGSMLFKTESMELPSIEPQESFSLLFNTSQPLPNVQNFIRNDWAMRQYQAIAKIGDQSFLLGTRALTLSAHYYQGPAHELPVMIK